VKSLGEDISKELAFLWSETTDRSEFESLAADKRRYEDERRNIIMLAGDSKKNAAVKAMSDGKRIAPATIVTLSYFSEKSSFCVHAILQRQTSSDCG
jgi:hypothetical protein